MTRPQRLAAQITTGIALGALTWALSVPFTGKIEPFDAESSHYYLIAMFVSGIGASLWSPRSGWLAVLAIFVGERFYTLIALPELRSAWLIGWMLNVIVPTWWPAAVGAAIVYVGSRCSAAIRPLRR